MIEQLYQSATSDSTCVMGFVNRIAIALEDVKNNARSLVFRVSSCFRFLIHSHPIIYSNFDMATNLSAFYQSEIR